MLLTLRPLLETNHSRGVT